MFYVGGTNHANPMMTFGNLGANRQVYVQLIGGDQGWDGDLNVTANGADVGADWTTVANVSANTGSLYAFDTVTNASGELSLGFNISAGNFAGVSGVTIAGQPGFAPPPVPSFQQTSLVQTNQILGPDASFDEVAAAINFRFSNQPAGAAGTVNGIDFEDVDWLAAEAGAVPLSQGGSVMVTTSFANGTARARNQNTAGTISGPDDTVLESVTNSIMFLGANESVTFDLTGLEPSTGVRVQLIGGDEGASLGNWLGDFDVLVNGQQVGLWSVVADDTAATASLATLLGTTDASGNLRITLNQINPPPGQFAGVGALIVTTAAPTPIPEPATAAVLGLAGLAMLRRRRRC
jgi:hypothetical protein